MRRPAIVIDNGSGFTKVGFASCEEPRSVFPSIIGTPNTTQLQVGGQNQDFFVGFEAVAKKDLLCLRRAMDDGIVNSWDDMERLWRHTFYDELHVVPEDYPVVVTEKPLTQRGHRKKLMQIMFDTFRVRAYYTGIQGIFTLFSLGKTTGVVWDAGDGVSHTNSIYEGYALPHAIQRSPISGTSLTEFAIRLLTKSAIAPKALSFQTAIDIKETVCSVALDFQAALQGEAPPAPYLLPAGSEIRIGVDKMRCPEALFNPQLIGETCLGVHQSIFNSFDNCEAEIKKDLYSSIVLTGGTTMFRGLPERIEKEVIALAQPLMKVRVIAIPGRRNSVWLGGSILASLDTFPQMYITREEYSEEGTQIVYRKCYI
jgi:actin-related protein